MRDTPLAIAGSELEARNLHKPPSAAFSSARPRLTRQEKQHLRNSTAASHSQWNKDYTLTPRNRLEYLPGCTWVGGEDGFAGRVRWRCGMSDIAISTGALAFATCPRTQGRGVEKPWSPLIYLLVGGRLAVP
jgi:hypothetical protein